MTLLLLAVAVPALLYVVLALPSVQSRVKNRAETQLSVLLDTKVEIGDVIITPFNRVTLRRVAVMDCAGDTALKVRRLGGGVSLTDLVFKHRLVFNYAEIIGLDARLKRDSLNGPLNIDCIIRALAPKDKNKPPTDFDFSIDAIVIRQSSVSYDVAGEPARARGIDPNHIMVSDLRADLRLPRMQRDDYYIDLRRLAFTGPSGLHVEGIECLLHITRDSISADGLSLALKSSALKFAPLELVPEGGISNIGKDLASLPVDVELLPGSHISMSDLRPILGSHVPASMINNIFDLDFHVFGTVDNLNLADLSINAHDGATGAHIAEISAAGSISGIVSDIHNAEFEIEDLSITGDGKGIAGMVPDVKAATVLGNAGKLSINLSGSGHMASGNIPLGDVDVSINTDDGSLAVVMATKPHAGKQFAANGYVELKDVDIAALLHGVSGSDALPGILSGRIDSDITYAKSSGIEGTTIVDIASVEYKGRLFNDIKAAVTGVARKYDMMLAVDNDGLDIDLDGVLDLNDKSRRTIDIDLTANRVDLSMFGVKRFTDLSVVGGGQMALINDTDGMMSLDGKMSFRDLAIVAEDGKELHIDKIDVVAESESDDDGGSSLSITSDILEAQLTGKVDPFTLPKDLKALYATMIPALIDVPEVESRGRNDFAFMLKLLTTRPLEDIIKLPVQVRYPVTLDGSFSAPAMIASLNLSAPYLWQGNKEIDNTSLVVSMDGSHIGRPNSTVTATTTMPTKNGMMTLDINMAGLGDAATLRTAWKVDSTRDFSGSLNLSGSVEKSRNDGKPVGRISVLPSEMVFNDTVWTVSPSVVTIENNSIGVDGFRVGRQGQFVTIDGTVSANDSDSLEIELKDVDLDYVFETLNISNAMFGGVATGRFHARNVMTSHPEAYTDDLSVKGLKYNFSLMGDALIKARYDSEKPAVMLSALINQPNGRHSTIDGYIKPTTEGYIDLDMQADKIEVGFMKPFMEAFASAVGGYASGRAHLYGTFHDINMSGDIFAEDLSLKLDFTGTTYWATDSVHLDPGYIDLSNIRLRDRDGNTGVLNGWLEHTNFHEPRFKFVISDAKDLLVYDIGPTPEQVWYGTIYGNGGAEIYGEPGRIDIKVDMSTAPKSSFTFILSDTEEAYDYTFITFRDREADISGEELIDTTTPSIVRELRKSLAKKIEQESSSIYDMNLTVRVNDDARLIVVMDPVGGDAIRARGDGVMTLTYNSASEELGLRGDYTLESGTYNFTFQDIIRKDFKIYPGSTIRFNGDPYSAQLNIAAGYRLTANLSDLDESFLDDPELTRTSVPVEAEIIITGDMRQPEIGYDFSFPTLKDDVKRKVNSIVSTEDMRARQMLYLLALSRFYTPDYMTATKGNELVSMASSTISSQLGNVLGQLTDKWSIAPNIRSDRGDFSDVEFDLALSSSLLNNRLLFNGNFGYRDKTLNNNSFIGDFDIEYLLNRSGSLRLKAYNRYNDQNFYVKNALTTQGVGLVYRRDFDDMLSFLRAFRRKKDDDKPITDSTGIMAPDTIINKTR